MTQICLTYTNQAKNCVNNSLPKHSPYVLKKGMFVASNVGMMTF